MKILNFKNQGPEGYYLFSTNKGKGTKEDPIIIEKQDIIPNQMKILNSNYYIHLKDCSFNLLYLDKCQRIKISNCIFDSIQLEKSAYLNISDSKVNELIFVRKCTNIQVDNTIISKLELIKSYDNTFNKGSIEEAVNTYSAGNVFSNIKLHQKYVNFLLKSKVITKVFLMITPIIVLIILSGTIHFWNIEPELAFLGLVWMGIILLVVSTTNILNYRKMRKYGPNILRSNK
ncbi:MAG: hypothetical protein ACFFD7_11770 [Candidatus Thorarchaeota archaeon]